MTKYDKKKREERMSYNISAYNMKKRVGSMPTL